MKRQQNQLYLAIMNYTFKTIIICIKRESENMARCILEIKKILKITVTKYRGIFAVKSLRGKWRPYRALSLN